MNTIEEEQSTYEENVALSSSIKGEYQDILLDSNGAIVWERPWQHNLIVNGMSRVLAALIKGDSQGMPLSFWAIGSGVARSSTISDKRERTTLIQEMARKSIEYITFLDAKKNPTAELSNQLEIKTYFTIDQIDNQAEAIELREFGLYAGGEWDPITHKPSLNNPGILINHHIHPKIELKKGFTLQRTLRLTF